MQVTCQRCGWQGENAQYCSRCGAGLGPPASVAPDSFPPSPVAPPAPAAAPVRVTVAGRPAGFWIRVVASMIDFFVLFIAQGILFGTGWMLSGGRMSSEMAIKAAVNFFAALIYPAYGIVFHWLWGQTLGKMALRIKVVSMDNGPLSFGQATGRYFGSVLSGLILCIGYIMAGIRTDKRALHDLLADTRVERL